ncbi:phospholipase A1-II 1-like [Bidens hawaiensis]|uniref:phospholipase A1-II 1-like n=1 Tax=Bidens hawaiensis TaxID=980011 RepID=UPI00404A1CD3
MNNIAKNWRTLNGENHWEGLLNPLPPDLRTYINHYGEMAEATYDAYIKTTPSRNAGNCKYARKNLLEKCGLLQGQPLNHYTITKYIYATSAIALPGAFVTSSAPQAWSKKSNWIGFIGVATDEGKKALGRRDILVAWRGTVNPSDMIHDSEFVLVSASIIFGENHKDDPKVHDGWYSIYTTNDVNTRYNKTSARDQAMEEVKELVNKYKHEEISLTITGHSMGAAIATLNAVDIILKGLNKLSSSHPPKVCPVTVFGFASPKVGDSGFKKVFNSLKELYFLRINNVPDVVPKYPLLGYSDVGSELEIETLKSPYLKGPGNPGIWHNMEGYMHGIAGVQTNILGGFKLEINRDLSLINKFGDILDDKYGIPGFWWGERNNGMVQKLDGTWELRDHE